MNTGGGSGRRKIQARVPFLDDRCESSGIKNVSSHLHHIPQIACRVRLVRLLYENSSGCRILLIEAFHQTMLARSISCISGYYERLLQFYTATVSTEHITLCFESAEPRKVIRLIFKVITPLRKRFPSSAIKGREMCRTSVGLAMKRFRVSWGRARGRLGLSSLL